MIDIACDACGSTDAKLKYVERDRLQHIPGEYRLVVCRNCGLYYLKPQPLPDELARHYPNNYFPYSIAVSDEASTFMRVDRAYGVHKRVRAVNRAARERGKILDVGCATGNFLDGMRQSGWDCYGVEISEHAANYARQRFGLNVVCGDLESARYPTGMFDTVTLWDVLEHVYKPRQTLAEIARVLKPGGLLVLSLPNPDCIEARLFGRYWAGWDAPRHLQLFTRKVLSDLLERSGIRIERVLSFTGRFHVLSLSLQFLLSDKLKSGNLQKMLQAAASSNLLRVMTWPYYSVADRLNQSSIMVIFARRN